MKQEKLTDFSATNANLKAWFDAEIIEAQASIDAALAGGVIRGDWDPIELALRSLWDMARNEYQDRPTEQGAFRTAVEVLKAQGWIAPITVNFVEDLDKLRPGSVVNEYGRGFRLWKNASNQYVSVGGVKFSAEEVKLPAYAFYFPTYEEKEKEKENEGQPTD